MIEVELRPLGNIRAVRRIPLSEICRMEGRNGIGKSLALRLCELATGGQPYKTEPRAWKSLRESVDFIRIAFALPDGRQLTWESSPGEWPVDPLDPTTPRGVHRLDGEPVTTAMAWGLVKLRRLAGDRAITDVIADRMTQDAAEADRLHASFKQGYEAVTSVASEVEASLRRLDTLNLVQAEDARTKALNSLAGVDLELADFESQASRVRRAIQMRGTADNLARDLPALEARLTEIEAKIERITLERQRLEERRTEAIRNADLEQEVQRKRSRAAKAVEDAERELTLAVERAERLKVEARIVDLDATRTLRTAKVKERNGILAEKTTIDRTPRLLGLVEEVLAPVSEATKGDLADETVLQVGEGAFSTREVRDGLSLRRAELLSFPPSSKVRELDRRLTEVNTTLDTLDKVILEYRRVEEAQRKVLSMRQRLRKLDNSLSPSAKADLEDLTSSLEKLQSARDDLGGEKARLLGQRGLLLRMGGKEELVREIDTATKSIGPPSTWEEVLSQIDSDITAVNSRRDAALVDIEALGREVGALSASHVSEMAALEVSQPWLLRRLGLSRGAGLDELKSAAPRVATEAGRVASVVAELEALNVSLLFVAGGLPELAQEIRSQSGPRFGKSETEHRQISRKHYEDFFASYFSSPRIGSALFGGGRFSGLNLSELSIAWTTQDGSELSRPLEAFSSGERAFAYTLTRLESLDLEGAEFRIVALDEFGAFIAQDRMPQLVEFLREQIIGSVADRIIIVLPASQDVLSAVLSESEDPAATALAKNYMERGYVVRDQNGRLLEA